MIKFILLFILFYVVFSAGKFFLRFFMSPSPKPKKPADSVKSNYKNIEEAKYVDLDNDSKE